MIKLLIAILLSCYGGLGVTQASMTSAVCDATGNDSSDAVVKVKRLINKKGTSFCNITDWPFLRSDLSFNITTSAYTYSGASYLPTTFKKVVASYILDGSDRYPLTEVSIQEAYEWGNPNDNQGRPDEFCITRNESGYYEIQFNRLPDITYTVYFEIKLHWVDLTSTTDETVITKEYYDMFSHFCTMARLQQQGDLENYATYKEDWKDIRDTALKSLKKPVAKPQIRPDESCVPNPYFNQARMKDYNKDA